MMHTHHAINSTAQLWRMLTLLPTLLMLIMALLARPAAARAPMAAIVVDARTGQVLFARNADSPRYPASISKVMTLYLLFREIRAGRLRLDSRLKVSRRATLKPPSKLWLKPGQTISVDQAIRALAVKSANDVAAVVAENIAGSEAAFARRMTAMARALGMTRTTFRNASGLPTPPNVSTARDLATLSLRLMHDFPRFYRRYFGLKTFRWRGRALRNHNHLLWRVAGMDGIKTGYTRAAGSNLAASVRRNGRRIVAVVLSAPSSRARNAYMARLIEQSFRRYRLARGTRIATLAGMPPGWNARRVRLAMVQVQRMTQSKTPRAASTARRKAVASLSTRHPPKARAKARNTEVIVIPARGQARQLARLALQAAVIPPVSAIPTPPKPRAAPRRSIAEKQMKRHMITPKKRPAVLLSSTGKDNGPAHDALRLASAIHSVQDRAVVARPAASGKETEKQTAHAAADASDTPAAAHKASTTAKALTAHVAVMVPEEDGQTDMRQAHEKMPVAGATAQPADVPSAPALRATNEKTATQPKETEDETGVLVITKRAPEQRPSASTAAAPPEMATAVGHAAGEQASLKQHDEASDVSSSVREEKPASSTAVRDNEASETILLANPARARQLMTARWLIQIGAFPTLEGARDYLKKARRLARDVRGHQPVVIRVRRGDKVFYRARYAGLSHRQAVRACRQLKRRGLSCLPMAPGAG